MPNNTSRRGMSPVLAFILGFLLAMIIFVGALTGGIIYALNYKLDNLEFNKDEDDNYLYINADPEGDTATVLQLVNKVMELSQSTDTLTLGQLEETFPVVNKLTDALQEAVGQYVELDMEALKNTTFNKLGKFLEDTLMDLQPAALLDTFGGDLADNKLLRMVFYDEDDNPITMRALTDGSAIDRLFDTPVLDLIGEEDGEYGDITGELLEGTTLGDLMNGLDFGDRINSLTLATFLKVNLSDSKPSASDCILAYIVYGITDIQFELNDEGNHSHVCTYNPIDGEKISPCYVRSENGEIKEVFYYEDGEKVTVKGTAINDVSTRAAGVTHDLTLGQIMDVSGNSLLGMIANSTIEGLSEDINGLAVNELYASSIYTPSSSDGGEEVEKYLAVPSASGMYRAESCESGYIYYVLSGGKYVLASTTGKLNTFENGKEYYTLGEGKILFDSSYVYYGADGKIINKGTPDAGKATEYSKELYTYGAANAMWKLMLYSDGSETVFSVNKLTQMISNVSANIQKSTMRELDEAGIVSMGDSLDTEINLIGNSEYNGKTIGDLTLSELLSLFTVIIKSSSVTPNY